MSFHAGVEKQPPMAQASSSPMLPREGGGVVAEGAKGAGGGGGESRLVPVPAGVTESVLYAAIQAATRASTININGIICSGPPGAEDQGGQNIVASEESDSEVTAPKRNASKKKRISEQKKLTPKESETEDDAEEDSEEESSTQGKTRAHGKNKHTKTNKKHAKGKGDSTGVGRHAQKNRKLGCSKCRYSQNGCGQCKNPKYTPIITKKTKATKKKLAANTPANVPPHEPPCMLGRMSATVAATTP